MKKKIIFISIVLFAMVCVGCTNAKVSDYQSTSTSVKKEPTLEETYSGLKVVSDDIISRLNQTGYFKDLSYSKMEKGANASQIDIIYAFNVDNGTKSNNITVSFLKNKLWEVEYTNNNDDYSDIDPNQILAIVYLKEFDIKESDFKNDAQGYRYSDFIKICAGTYSEIASAVRATENGKNLSILSSKSMYNHVWIFSVSYWDE